MPDGNLTIVVAMVWSKISSDDRVGIVASVFVTQFNFVDCFWQDKLCSNTTLPEKCPYLELFWSVVSPNTRK